MLAVVAGALIAGAVAAWALEEAHQGEIAAGIEVGGVDVGGMSAGEARRTLDRRLVEPLRRPVRIVYEGETWTLPAPDLGVRAGLADAVSEALEASGEQGLPSRVWRYVTGGEVEREIDPQITYSKPAVTEFIQRVAGEINRDPEDARVEPTGTSLEIVEERAGVKLRDRLLTDQVEAMLLDPGAPRTVRARTMAVEPELTVDALPSSYPYYLTLNRSSFELRLWEDLELVKTYTVAVGQVGLDTPAGLYTIQNKAVDPAWHVPDSDWAGDLAGEVIPGGVPENPLKERWLGIYDGAGIHGTDDTGSLGTAASHGCVRMAIPEVIELYDRIPVGTPIYIA